MIKIVTYEDRVKKMNVLGDEVLQIQRAKQYIRLLKARKNKAATLAEKIDLMDAIKRAESVLRKLRTSVFDLEDMLRSRSVAS